MPSRHFSWYFACGNRHKKSPEVRGTSGLLNSAQPRSADRLRPEIPPGKAEIKSPPVSGRKRLRGFRSGENRERHGCVQGRRGLKQQVQSKVDIDRPSTETWTISRKSVELPGEHQQIKHSPKPGVSSNGRSSDHRSQPCPDSSVIVRLPNVSEPSSDWQRASRPPRLSLARPNLVRTRAEHSGSWPWSLPFLCL